MDGNVVDAHPYLIWEQSKAEIASFRDARHCLEIEDKELTVEKLFTQTYEHASEYVGSSILFPVWASISLHELGA